MKGILLAGGRGTRLYPLTMAVSKQLMPVYNQPLIYYSLSTLILSGCDEICVVTNPGQADDFRLTLGDGSRFGVSIQYQIQYEPNGIAEVFLIAEKFVAGQPVALALGDNIFHGPTLGRSLRRQDPNDGALIFGVRVANPGDYGVLELDGDGQVVAIEEKPEYPKSNFAVPGLYFYDQHVSDYAARLVPSARGELEITDLNNAYLEEDKLAVRLLPRGVSWMDTGTFEDLADATNYVRAVQKREGRRIGCPEEAALSAGFLGLPELSQSLVSLPKSSYRDYLEGLVLEGSAVDLFT